MDEDHNKDSCKWEVPKLNLWIDDGICVPADAEFRTYDNTKEEDDYILEGCLSPRELYMGLDTRLCWAARCWDLKMAREAALQASHAALTPAPKHLPPTEQARIELLPDQYLTGAGNGEIPTKKNSSTLTRLRKLFGQTKGTTKNLKMDHLSMNSPHRAPTDSKDNLLDTIDISGNGLPLTAKKTGKPTVKRGISLLKRICGRFVGGGQIKYRRL